MTTINHDYMDESQGNYELFKRKLYPIYKKHGQKEIAGLHKIFHHGNELFLFTTRTTPGAKIRNAMIGSFYNDRVGSINEYKYFKVTLATGHLKYDSNHLYYDNPEEYERHFKCNISKEVKDEWRERNGILPMCEDPNTASSDTEVSDDNMSEYTDIMTELE